MPVIDWRDEYLTGDSVIDAQHRALGKMTNDLHEALLVNRPNDAIEPMLRALARYWVRHFDAERQLMEASGYPGTRLHLKQHEDIEKRTQEAIETQMKGRLSLGVSVSQSLGRWLAEHIVGEDKRMVQWSRINGGHAAPSGHFPLRDSTNLLVARTSASTARESQTLPLGASSSWSARDSLRQLVAASDLLAKK